MVKITNLSHNWSTDFLKPLVKFSTPKLVKNAEVFITDIWFDFENYLETGEFKSVDYDVEWDGLCFYELGKVFVHLKYGIEYPFVWWVNEDFKDSYQRGMILRSPEEYFVYCIAHEQSHINQTLTKKRLGKGYKGADDEMDADIFAIIKLNEYRRKNK